VSGHCHHGGVVLDAPVAAVPRRLPAVAEHAMASVHALASRTDLRPRPTASRLTARAHPRAVVHPSRGIFMSSNRWPLRAALACAASGLLCTSVAAQTAPTFQTLLKEAQASAPRLALGAAETRVAEGQAVQAAVRPNPTLGLMVENAAGSGPYKDFDSAETTLSIEQPLELGGKRAARTSAAQADLAAAQARAAFGQVDFARDLALAYANAEAAQQRLAIARDSVDLAQADAKAARLLVDNGKEAQVRAIQAEAGLATARADMAVAQAETEAALARLSALTGSPETYTAVAGGLLDAAPATPLDRAGLQSGHRGRPRRA
jgi:cobalt-zinc-cadmium efflux system outer membrane protein